MRRHAPITPDHSSASSTLVQCTNKIHQPSSNGTEIHQIPWCFGAVLQIQKFMVSNWCSDWNQNDTFSAFVYLPINCNASNVQTQSKPNVLLYETNILLIFNIFVKTLCKLYPNWQYMFEIYVLLHKYLGKASQGFERLYC